MSGRRLWQVGAWLVAGVIVLLIALYVFTSSSPIPEPLANGPTPYPSIVLFPTLVPTPAPDMRPHLVDLANGNLEPVPIPVDSTVQAVLSDGALLVTNGPQGPATVVRTDGTSISALLVPQFVRFDLSVDHRYVAWIASGHLRVYDAETRTVSTEPPPTARFEFSLQDGGVLMSDAAGAWPASPPSATGGQPGEESVIVDGTGMVTDRLLAPRWMVGVSPDKQRFAWVNGDGLHVWERATRAERVFPEVTAVTGGIAWSPDATEIAYRRFTGNDRVHIWIVNLASGEQHRAYSAEPDSQIQRVAFATNQELELRISPLASLGAQYDLPGSRYVVDIDGNGGRFLDDPTKPWSSCGPPCGLPPVGYEDADGLGRWCEQSPGGNCISHLVLVHRGEGVLRELAASELVTWSVSPDRQQLAILFSVGTDQQLKIVRLDDLSERDIPLGFTYAGAVAWLPDGQSWLLWTAGGN